MASTLRAFYALLILDRCIRTFTNCTYRLRWYRPFGRQFTRFAVQSVAQPDSLAGNARP
jgi:hypothetical protein